MSLRRYATPRPPPHTPKDTPLPVLFGPQDIEAYIHRSGRTGRAGRTGVCIMFYKPQQEYMVPMVERRAGIHFQRIGAPQLSDVIGAAARDASRYGEEAVGMGRRR